MANRLGQLNDILSDLPDFVFDFIKKYYDGESVNTQHGYAIDIRTFLRFLMAHPAFGKITSIEEFTASDLEVVGLDVLLDYKVYLERYESCYTTPTGRTKTVVLTNGKKGTLRKLCTLRSLYGYMFKADLIEKDITQKLSLPRISHHPKKPLSFQDTLAVIDVFFRGEQYFASRELSNYHKTRQRNVTIFTTLLGTGLRVSELLGLNLEDIDFENSSLVVLRKGGDSQEIPMPVQVENEIFRLVQERKAQNIPEQALFVSNRSSRLTVSSVEKMIRKYCAAAGIYNADKTTVHALRRTFACRLLEDGIDLKLVSELLGHADISVTARFYAQHNKATHRRVMNALILPLPEKGADKTMRREAKAVSSPTPQSAGTQ